MKQVSTQAKVLTRDEAVQQAAWAIARAREKLAELYGWALAGEATSWVAPTLLARDILEALEEARALAIAFADVLAFGETVGAFLEEARLEAARILREKEPAQPAGEEEVPF
ncbi:hypothetical protein TthSNM11_24910 (plasmid) [Thermus thermophilus]|uniref:Uncharacterized protein n=1 Tax=Thermus arciformis TaxID=482827 RepID=A0A1G7LVJ7_9DEIN|nr:MULTISPECIES: hypothetical protein [Thermus]BDG20288.1 hypothetical protein TthSNM11_24910 [Thermus thermophilus]SDF53463.1 hypothetical protein SAMN04488243_1812 [Thermus arciformis]